MPHWKLVWLCAENVFDHCPSVYPTLSGWALISPESTHFPGEAYPHLHWTQHISLAAGLTQMVRTSSHTCQWYFTSQCWLARERTQSNTYFITQLTVLKLLCQISSWIHIYQWVIKFYWAHYCLKCQSWVVLLERWKHLDGYNSILEPRWTHTWIWLRFVLHVCNSR